LKNSNAAPHGGQELLVQAIGPALVTAYGQPVPSARLKEQDYVLLYFSAGWCGPCREFTPNLVNFYSEHRNADFEVVLVSSDQSPNAMLAYMREAQMPFTAVPYERVEGSQLKARYGRSGIPHLVVVDRQGEVVVGSVGDEPRVSPLQVLQEFRELIEAEVGDVAEPDEPEEELQVRGPRQWNTTDGRYSVVASLVSVADGIVRLRLEEGQTVNVPLERLSQEDRQYVRQYLARAEGN
jgi:thiol-disulfide isomerase/thioredoxin